MSEKTYNILFVCHGNICRSPMAEFVMKDMVDKEGLKGAFHIESAATSYEEIGNPVYPPARRKLAEHNIACDGKHARRITAADYDKFDIIVGMDDWNIKNIKQICGDDDEHKVFKLLDFAHVRRDVADPWYTGDFEATWRDVVVGCEGIMNYYRQRELPE